MMGVLSIMAYVGSQLRRIWLSLPPFLLMGLYWLWRVELIADGAFKPAAVFEIYASLNPQRRKNSLDRSESAKRKRRRARDNISRCPSALTLDGYCVAATSIASIARKGAK